MAVYFIENPINGRIKIGNSFSVRKRIKDLTKEHKAPLKLLGVMEGDFSEEKELHLKFDSTRITGEWFMATSTLLDFIKKHAMPLDELHETPPCNKTGLMSKIKEIAQKQGYNTPEQLSQRTTLSSMTVRNIWTGDIGNRQIGSIVIIADILNVPFENLFELVED